MGCCEIIIIIIYINVVDEERTRKSGKSTKLTWHTK